MVGGTASAILQRYFGEQNMVGDDGGDDDDDDDDSAQEEMIHRFI